MKYSTHTILHSSQVLSSIQEGSRAAMKNNVVRMKILENIADLDFEDNITNIVILSRCW
jgi:diphthamide biosynthesis methyltransferase